MHTDQRGQQTIDHILASQESPEADRAVPTPRSSTETSAPPGDQVVDQATDQATGDTGANDGASLSRRVARKVLLLGLVLAVLVPVPWALVLAWQLHPLLAVAAYFLGIPAYLSAVMGVGAVVSRLRAALTSTEAEKADAERADALRGVVEQPAG